MSSITTELDVVMAGQRAKGSSVEEARAPRDCDQRSARVAGALYLAIFVLGPFVYFYVPSELFLDDVGETAAAIEGNVRLFAAGMVAETLIIAVEIFLAGMLWKLFRKNNEALAFSSSIARVGEAFIQTINVILAGLVLIVVDRNGLAGFDLDPSMAVELLIEAIGFGVMVWGLLFGFHLLLLGVLVRRSGRMPGWIGTALIVASIGYLAQSYGYVLNPELDAALANLVAVLAIPGELAFAGYLLFRGIRPAGTFSEVAS